MSAHGTADLTSVSKTMLLTLHARAEHTLSERPRFTDPAAVELVSRLDYDFTMARQDRLMADGVVLRTLTLDPLVAGYLDTHPGCTVVNIACGLDTRFQRLDDGRVTWYDLDLPDVIALRRRLLEDGERHRTIAASALDPDWPDQLEDMSRDVLVIIEGLSMYLEQEEVRTLLDIIAARLPGATVLIEVMPRLFQKYGRERSVEDAGARYTYGCSSAAEFRRTVAPGYTLLHDVPFTRTIARYHPLLAPLTWLPLVGRLSERILVLRALAWAPEDVTPQKMSNPESEYTAESLPDDLDDTGKEIAGVYVASDRLTWEAFRAMDGDLSQVETVMTGEAFRYFDDLYSDYQANGWHMEGQYSTSVQDVSVSEGNAGQATMMACNDQRQIRVVSDGGEDAGKDTAHTYMRRITLIKDEESGTWMVSSDEKVGVDQC